MSDNDQEYEPESEPIEAQEPEQQGWDGVSEPKPVMFDDYDDYVKSLTDWKVRQVSEEISARQAQTLAQRRGFNPNADPRTVLAEAVREGLEADRAAQALAQAQAQQDVGPVPDDPKRAERSYWSQLSMDASKAAIKAKEAGDTQKFHEWRQRQLQYENEIEKLGPTPERQFAEDLVDHQDELGMKVLMDPKRARDPVWQNERIKNDAPVVVQRQLERARNVVRLPMEDSPHGNPLPCEPQNMVSFSDLPQDVIASIRSRVQGASDPDAAIRRAWAVIHQTGYAGTAKPVVEPKGKTAPSETEEDPDKMSWRQFVAWREAQEDARRKRVYGDGGSSRMGKSTAKKRA